MRIRLILTAAAALLLGSRGVAAQTVVTPEPKLSPEKQVVNDAIYRLRDSLVLVEAAGARFVRDRQQASDAGLRSRARLMADRCRSAMAESDSTHAAVQIGGLPSPDPRGHRTRMEKSIGQLRTKLAWCDGEFTRLAQPAQADELRGYAVGRAGQVSTAVQSFIAEIGAYLTNGVGTRYKPSVRGAGSVASGSSR